MKVGLAVFTSAMALSALAAPRAADAAFSGYYRIVARHSG